MEPAATPFRLQSIDGLRGIAIALVVIYHVWLVYGVDLGVVSRVGFLGVDLFFALSGFCLFYPYARARFGDGTAPTLKSYFAKRSLKIVPSYLLALAVFTIAYVHRDGANGILASLAAHLTFLHPLFAQQFQSISGPLWTIGIEVQFYAIFPLLAGLFVARPWLGALLAGGFANGFRAVLAAVHADTTFFWVNQLAAFLDVFAAGILAAYFVAWYRRRTWHPAAKHVPSIVALAALATAAWGCTVLAQSPAMNDTGAFFAWQTQSRWFVAVLLFALVSATTLASPAILRVLANPALTFLGIVSYNLYLWHLEVLAFGNQSGMPSWLAVAAALAIAVAVTYALERPILELPSRLRGRAGRPHSLPDGEVTDRRAA
ncbi:MAG TPA: acyltransferase [Candidatus Acidoferrales bacterium]|nr:acyltransferase [Candidatus Acidoferrales bacterium]